MLCLIVTKTWRYQHLGFTHSDPPALTERTSAFYASHHGPAVLSTYQALNTAMHAADPVSDHDDK